jgi:hypothetical protein
MTPAHKQNDRPSAGSANSARGPGSGRRAARRAGVQGVPLLAVDTRARGGGRRCIAGRAAHHLPEDWLAERSDACLGVGVSDRGSGGVPSPAATKGLQARSVDGRRMASSSKPPNNSIGGSERAEGAGDLELGGSSAGGTRGAVSPLCRGAQHRRGRPTLRDCNRNREVAPVIRPEKASRATGPDAVFRETHEMKLDATSRMVLYALVCFEAMIIAIFIVQAVARRH